VLAAARTVSGATSCSSGALQDFEGQILQSLGVDPGPITLEGTAPSVGVAVPFDVKDPLGVQYLGFNIANFADSDTNAFREAYATPSHAIFNPAGLNTPPSISPVLNQATALTRFDLYSLYIAPIFADSLTIEFTPYGGGNTLPLLLNDCKGTAFSKTVTRSSEPTRIDFPTSGNGTFLGISNVQIRVTASTGQVPSGLLNINTVSLDQYAIDSVCAKVFPQPTVVEQVTDTVSGLLGGGSTPSPPPPPPGHRPLPRPHLPRRRRPSRRPRPRPRPRLPRVSSPRLWGDEQGRSERASVPFERSS